MKKEHYEKANKIQEQIKICNKLRNGGNEDFNYYHMLILFPNILNMIDERKEELEKEFEEL